MRIVYCYISVVASAANQSITTEVNSDGELQCRLRLHDARTDLDFNLTAKISIGPDSPATDVKHSSHIGVFLGEPVGVRLEHNPNVYMGPGVGILSVNPSGLLVSQFDSVALLATGSLLLNATESEFLRQCHADTTLSIPVSTPPVVTLSCEGCNLWEAKPLILDELPYGELLTAPVEFLHEITSILFSKGAFRERLSRRFSPCNLETVRALPDLVMSFKSGGSLILSPEDYMTVRSDVCIPKLSFERSVAESDGYRFNPLALVNFNINIYKTSITLCDSI